MTSPERFESKGLKNLDSLILAHNQLSKVPANVFSHLTLLNSLELEGNQITYVDKDAFAGLEGKSHGHKSNSTRKKKMFLFLNRRKKNEAFSIFNHTKRRMENDSAI